MLAVIFLLLLLNQLSLLFIPLFNLWAQHPINTLLILFILNFLPDHQLVLLNRKSLLLCCLWLVLLDIFAQKRRLFLFLCNLSSPLAFKKPIKVILHIFQGIYIRLFFFIFSGSWLFLGPFFLLLFLLCGITFQVNKWHSGNIFHLLIIRIVIPF